MKDFKDDNAATLSRFAKDKRLRQPRAERVERQPRQSFGDRPEEGREYGREGGYKPAGGRRYNAKPAERASYNPNFTKDNRPKKRFSAAEGDFGEHRTGGYADRDNRGSRKPSAGKRPGTGFRSESPAGEQPYGKKPFGGRNGAAHHAKPYGGKRGPEGAPAQERKNFAGGLHRKAPAQRQYPKYDPMRPLDEIRLNRFVAQSGLCSRREADDYISAGLVTVNGEVATELGTKIRPSDDVRFNGERLHGEKNVYLVLNKPKGYVTTLEDDHADKTVADLVRGACTERIYPVGRLDKNSLGLLLFTNDGDMARQLTHPSYRKKKVYEVTLDKALTRADFERLAEGITLEDGDIYCDEISYLKDDRKSVGVEIHSGRNRIVRRMFEHLGYGVTKLDRVYYAGLTKKNLKRGAWRFLTDVEVARLKSGRYE